MLKFQLVPTMVLGLVAVVALVAYAGSQLTAAINAMPFPR